MRILHLVHQYPPEHVGGVELYTQSVAAYQVRQHGHQVAIFHPSAYLPEETAGEELFSLQEREDGTRVYGVCLGPRSRTRVFLSTFGEKRVSAALASVLALEEPDLVHVQHLMGLPASVVEQVQSAGIPVVITLHDYWFPCANAQLLTNYDHTICAGPSTWWLNCARCALARAGRDDSPWLAPFLTPVMGARSRRLRQLLAAARQLIAPAHFVRDTYAQLGMPVEHLSVIPHGIEVPLLPERHLERKTAADGVLRIGYIGGISRQKGVHVIVEAVRAVEGVELRVAGNLEFDPAYAAELREASGENTHFLGSLDRTGIGALLAQIDVLTVPSLWYETFALVISEAYAAGIPVLASDLGVLAERVRHDTDGLLLPPGDVAAWREAVVRLREQPQFLARLTAAVEPPLLLEAHVRALENVYQAAC